VIDEYKFEFGELVERQTGENRRMRTKKPTPVLLRLSPISRDRRQIKPRPLWFLCVISDLLYLHFMQGQC